MSNKAKIRDLAMKLNPIDDNLFLKMSEDKDFCQEIIRVFLEDSELSVIENQPQYTTRNMQGRSCILDLYCRLGNGKLVNIEVQKANDDDHQRRMRYNAALLTTNTANPRIKFKDVPDVIVIMISKFDIFKKGRAMYHIDRVVRESGEKVENGLKEIYVNAEADDNTDAAALMKIFIESEVYNDEKFPATSRQKRIFKTTEKGVNEMCEMIEKYGKEERSEGKIEGGIEAMKKLYEAGIITAQIAAATLGLTEIEFKKKVAVAL